MPVSWAGWKNLELYFSLRSCRRALGSSHLTFFSPRLTPDELPATRSSTGTHQLNKSLFLSLLQSGFRITYEPDAAFGELAGAHPRTVLYGGLFEEESQPSSTMSGRANRKRLRGNGLSKNGL